MKNLLKMGMVAATLVLMIQTVGLANAVTKVSSEVIEQAFKISGKAVTPAAKAAAEKALEKAVAQYGDDVLRSVRLGGLEALEQGTKHGDDFWRLCATVPDGVRSLALHADELMPLARRIGPDVLHLEAKAPGLATKVVSNFGDDAVPLLSKAPADDISRMIGYAQKAESAEAQKLLFQSYKSSKNGSKFLDSLDWKKIMAGGLSVSMIMAAYKVSDGIQNATETIAEKSPEKLPGVFESITSPFRYAFYSLLSLAAIFLLYLLRGPVKLLARGICRRLTRRDQKKRQAVSTDSPHSPER